MPHGFGIGCTVCHVANRDFQGDANVWATYRISRATCQPSSFAKHEQCAAHKSMWEQMSSSLRRVGESDAGTDSTASHVAPQCDEFLDVIRHLWNGDTETARAGRWKFRRL
eukprot:3444829-Amphidinium_carterae.1